MDRQETSVGFTPAPQVPRCSGADVLRQKILQVRQRLSSKYGRSRSPAQSSRLEQAVVAECEPTGFHGCFRERPHRTRSPDNHTDPVDTRFHSFPAPPPPPPLVASHWQHSGISQPYAHVPGGINLRDHPVPQESSDPQAHLGSQPLFVASTCLLTLGAQRHFQQFWRGAMGGD